MQLDHSLDFLCWDNTETGTLTSRRKTGDMSDLVSGVLRGAVTGKELRESNGAYTGDDVTFLVARNRIASLLAQDRKPKPGDTYQDANGVEFTVLGVDEELKDQGGPQVFRLTCRDLVLAYDLRDVVDIERPRVTLDGAGVKTKGWPPGDGSVPYRSIPAKVQRITEDVLEQWGLVALKGSYIVIVGRQVTLDLEERIKWIRSGVTRYLDIVELRNPERIDELPVIGAELRP